MTSMKPVTLNSGISGAVVLISLGVVSFSAPYGPALYECVLVKGSVNEIA
jgi:hypothetical protein